MEQINTNDLKFPYCLYEDVDKIFEIIEERDPKSPKQIKIGNKKIKIPDLFRAEYKYGFITTTMRMNDKNGNITYNNFLDDIFFDRLYSSDEIGFSKGKSILEILKRKNDAEYFRAMDGLNNWQGELKKTSMSDSIKMIIEYHKNVLAEFKIWYAAKQYPLPNKRIQKSKKYHKCDKIDKAKLFIEAYVKTYPSLPDFDVLSKLPDSPAKETWRRDVKLDWLVDLAKQEIDNQIKSKRTPSKKKIQLENIGGIIEEIKKSNSSIWDFMQKRNKGKSVKAKISYDEGYDQRLFSRKELSATVYRRKEEADDSMIQELFEAEQARGQDIMESNSRIQDIEGEANPQ